jgi:hypothetical protein
MDPAEIQVKIAKGVQQKELGNQQMAANNHKKALYHYHYALNYANGMKENGATDEQKVLIDALLASYAERRAVVTKNGKTRV